MESLFSAATKSATEMGVSSSLSVPLLDDSLSLPLPLSLSSSLPLSLSLPLLPAELFPSPPFSATT